jgi:hypothetical protein
VFLAPSHSDLCESLPTTNLLGEYLGDLAGKTPTAGAPGRELADGRQKNSMAPLDDNSTLAKGTSFYVGSWIFIADESGGFNSRPIDQNAQEAARRKGIDDFIDQLEEVGFSAHDSRTRNQPDFDTINPKTPSEMEKDLNKLLEDTKQETTIDETILSSGYQQDII